MIAIIVAINRNRGIGFENRLLYRLPDDLKRFKQLTLGHTVIMGRKTFESLPNGALPGRRNIVLSRTHTSFQGAECFSSLQEALRQCASSEQIFIIGGGQLYAEALPLADRVFLTEVEDSAAQADVFFPELPAGEWILDAREEHSPDSKHAFAFSFSEYIRKN